jgi:hypothetical protein
MHIRLAQYMDEYWSDWNIRYPPEEITNMVCIRVREKQTKNPWM